MTAAGASSPVATLLRHVSFRSLSTSKVLSDKQKQGPDISQLSTDMQRLWNHAENTHLDHVVVTACSRRKVHWLCNKCPDGVPHKWQAPVTNVWRSHRKHRNGCPYCASKAVCSHNSLVRHAPHLVKEWDDAKNPYMPQDYTVSASYNAHWKCDQGHEWQTSIGNRVQRRTGCPECARISPRQKLPSLEANAENILQGWDWERNNQEGIDHRQLTCGSRKKAHFKCPSGHTWLAQIRDIFRNKGTGCPDCNRQRSATS